MPTYLSMSISCGMCGKNRAPEHNNGKFKYVVVFSQTADWAQCCKNCAEETAELPTNIDFVYKQDINGMGWEWGKEMPQGFVNFPDEEEK